MLLALSGRSHLFCSLEFYGVRLGGTRRACAAILPQYGAMGIVVRPNETKQGCEKQDLHSLY